ncbi:MAG TPA: lipid II flippase MurJ, partial [Patescibacteria group bacterium]|nr:lipid II flippase MurJ [Patescibacteria group bacterium]
KTPVRISATMAIVNIAVALFMTRFIDVAGISFATGMAGWVQCYFLWNGLRNDEATKFDTRLKHAAPRIFVASVLMGVEVFCVNHLLADWFYDALPLKLAALMIMVGAGFLAYFVSCHCLHVLRVQDIQKYFRHRRGVLPVTQEVEE